MKRTWTIIGVADVPQSFKWYQSLLGLPETAQRRGMRQQVRLSEKGISGQFARQQSRVWTAPWQELSDVAAALVGCGHVSGVLMRRVRPLALMRFADPVPIERTHSKMR
jgi:hypothetical protein